MTSICDLEGRIYGDPDALDVFEAELKNGSRRAMPRRINPNAESVEKDVAKLVLSLVDLIRHLVERQAIRRVNGGSLTEDEVERMGEVFWKLDEKMVELKSAFGLEDEDLNLNLGPISDLL